MMSKTHRGPLVLALLVSLFAGLALVATADDQQSMVNEEKAATKEKAAAETKPQQVYQMNGMTVVWNMDEKAFQSPTAEQANALGEQFNAWVEAQLAGDKGVMPSEDAVTVKTLDNGVRMANLPASMLSASVVRVDENGNFVVGDCADSAENTGKLLNEPVHSHQLEEE